MPEHRTYSIKLDEDPNGGWYAALWGRTPKGGYQRIADGTGPEAIEALGHAVWRLGIRELEEGRLP